jgi:uncharacterized protein
MFINHSGHSVEFGIFTTFPGPTTEGMISTIELFHYALVLAVGFLVGYINTIAGSGSLLTLPLLIWLGLDPLTANGTNRIAILLQAFTGVVMFHRKKQYHFRYDMRFIIPAVIGSLPGAFIAVDLPKGQMEKVIAIVMLVMLVLMILDPQKRFRLNGRDFRGKQLVLIVVFFFIGMYGGFIQAGVGIFMLIAFALFEEMNLLRANAVKVLITMIFTIVVLPVFILNGQVNYLYGIMMGLGSMAGAWLSARMAVKRGTPFLKAALYIVVFATSVYMLIKQSV